MNVETWIEPPALCVANLSLHYNWWPESQKWFWNSNILNPADDDMCTFKSIYSYILRTTDDLCLFKQFRIFLLSLFQYIWNQLSNHKRKKITNCFWKGQLQSFDGPLWVSDIILFIAASHFLSLMVSEVFIWFFFWFTTHPRPGDHEYLVSQAKKPLKEKLGDLEQWTPDKPLCVLYQPLLSAWMPGRGRHRGLYVSWQAAQPCTTSLNKDNKIIIISVASQSAASLSPN